MKKFKVGDRVRIIAGGFKGTTGSIKTATLYKGTSYYTVSFFERWSKPGDNGKTGTTLSLSYSEKELEKA